MDFLSFGMGVGLGFGIWFWQRYQWNRQLKQMLLALPNRPDLKTSLPMLSIVRRELLNLAEGEQQLLERLNLQKTLLALSPIGYLEVDGENQLLWCNQQARILLKIDRWQSGQIRLLLELVRSYELDQLIETTRKTQNSQTIDWIFYPTRHAFESESSQGVTYDKSLALKATSHCLLSDGVGVFIENKQPLVEISRSRERAFSDLTHELRTPLTAIMLVAETLQKRLDNPERRWVEQMLQEIQRMMKLVQDWLQISQLQEYSSQVLSYHSLDIVDVLMAAWEKILPLAQQKSVALSYIGPDNLQIDGDGDRLLQVFLNLFENAVKFSPKDSTICLEVYLRENQVEINVIDQGDGFAPKDLPHVFERLYRGDPSRFRDQSSLESSLSGSGLGLSIAQQIIDSHRGLIVAKNHPETQGAWVQIFLPLK